MYKNTTLGYIERDGAYLMLHRVKKENDLNHDKWVGIGGKFEDGESPEECMCREALEETGLTLHAPRLRGIVTFVSNEWDNEYMFLYTCTDFSGELIECNEGDLEWVPMERVPDLPIWQGDKIFLDLLCRDAPFFSLKLQYEGDDLVYAALDGKPLNITEKD
ncbi:MAG: 8-oxo-dGTP diphosphatase [Oscillospiraceae bacterium]|nr:8-oxo-dGTP diphosphatase [Oscillospiraceae bacterium]